MKKIFIFSVFALFTQTTLFYASDNEGSLHVITGSMCSGKSWKLVEIAQRILRSHKRLGIYKSATDNRPSFNENDPANIPVISSRTKTSIKVTLVESVKDLDQKVTTENPECVIIDEVHFFTPETEAFVNLIRKFIEKENRRVILSGLAINFKGEAFGPLPTLLAYANVIETLTANCSKCHKDTYCYTQKLVDGRPAPYNSQLIEVGSSQYEPRCRKCHECPKE